MKRGDFLSSHSDSHVYKIYQQMAYLYILDESCANLHYFTREY